MERKGTKERGARQSIRISEFAGSSFYSLGHLAHSSISFFSPPALIIIKSEINEILLWISSHFFQTSRQVFYKETNLSVSIGVCSGGHTSTFSSGAQTGQ